MNHHHKKTHLIDTQEQDMKKYQVELYALHYETNENFIPEEGIEYVHPDLYKKFLSPAMNSGIMTIHQNDTEKIIDDPEDFFQYYS